MSWQLEQFALSKKRSLTLKSLSRPLAKDVDPTVLYGTRDEAMFYNLKGLSAMPETEVALKAVDTGSTEAD